MKTISKYVVTAITLYVAAVLAAAIHAEMEWRRYVTRHLNALDSAKVEARLIDNDLSERLRILEDREHE